MPKIPWKLILEIVKPLIRALSLKWVRRGKETGWIDPSADRAPRAPTEPKGKKTL